MKKVIFTILGFLMLSPVLSAASEEPDSVIAYTTYPNDVISYIYVIPAQEDDQKSDQSPDITYLKPPVFTSQLFAGRNYKTVLCGKYTICN
jgi:hypothetical protein